MKSGGAADRFGEMLLEHGCVDGYSITAIDDEFIKQAQVERSLEILGLNYEAMITAAKDALGRKDNG